MVFDEYNFWNTCIIILIIKISKKTKYILLFKVAGGNGAGSTAAQLYYPWGIYVDSSQGIYIVDRSNHRVQYWPYGK